MKKNWLLIISLLLINIPVGWSGEYQFQGEGINVKGFDYSLYSLKGDTLQVDSLAFNEKGVLGNELKTVSGTLPFKPTINFDKEDERFGNFTSVYIKNPNTNKPDRYIAFASDTGEVYVLSSKPEVDGFKMVAEIKSKNKNNLFSPAFIKSSLKTAGYLYVVRGGTFKIVKLSYQDDETLNCEIVKSYYFDNEHYKKPTGIGLNYNDEGSLFVDLVFAKKLEDFLTLLLNRNAAEEGAYKLTLAGYPAEEAEKDHQGKNYIRPRWIQVALKQDGDVLSEPTPKVREQVLRTQKTLQFYHRRSDEPNRVDAASTIEGDITRVSSNTEMQISREVTFGKGVGSDLFSGVNMPIVLRGHRSNLVYLNSGDCAGQRVEKWRSAKGANQTVAVPVVKPFLLKMLENGRESKQSFETLATIICHGHQLSSGAWSGYDLISLAPNGSPVWPEPGKKNKRRTGACVMQGNLPIAESYANKEYHGLNEGANLAFPSPLFPRFPNALFPANQVKLSQLAPADGLFLDAEVVVKIAD
ncbi:hypothetical protein N9V90_03160 [Endozoicomonas sp.]|nr:hypothetical protein [Endozoicomonas sp.]